MTIGMIPGFLAICLGFGFLVFIHELGHWAVARMLGFKTPVFAVGFGPRRWSLVLGTFMKTEWRLSPIPLGGYVSIPELGDESTLGKDKQFKRFPVWKRLCVAVAGVVMNLLFAVVAIFCLFAFIGPPVNHVQSTYVTELGAPDGTIAGGAGIKAGDQFVTIGRHSVTTSEDVVAALAKYKSTPVVIVVEREGVDVPITLTPSGEGRIGAKLGHHVERVHTPMPVGVAASGAVQVTGNVIKEMYVNIAVMARLIDKPAHMPDAARDVHSIVSIVSVGQQAFDMGLYTFLMIIAMISLNLAVFNILPLPMLDGGHMLFFTIEGVFGKPVPIKVRNVLAYAFIGFFLCVMVLGLYNDVTKPIKL